MKQVFDTMSEATGVDFTEIMRAGTYDARVNRNVNLPGNALNVHMDGAAKETRETRETKDTE